MEEVAVFKNSRLLEADGCCNASVGVGVVQSPTAAITRKV